MKEPTFKVKYTAYQPSLAHTDPENLPLPKHAWHRTGEYPVESVCRAIETKLNMNDSHIESSHIDDFGHRHHTLTFRRFEGDAPAPSKIYTFNVII